MIIMQFQNGSLSLDAIAYIKDLDDDERARLARSAAARNLGDIKRRYITKIVGLDNVPILEDVLTRAELVQRCESLGLSFVLHGADGVAIPRGRSLLVSYAPYAAAGAESDAVWQTRCRISAPGFKSISLLLKTPLAAINSGRAVVDLRPKLLAPPQASLPLAGTDVGQVSA